MVRTQASRAPVPLLRLPFPEASAAGVVACKQRAYYRGRVLERAVGTCLSADV